MRLYEYSHRLYGAINRAVDVIVRRAERPFAVRYAKGRAAMPCLVGVFFVLMTAVGWGGEAEDTDKQTPDLTKISLEDLFNVEVKVTSASKKEQKLSEVPSAIYVITQEDIRRSGSTNIPDLLRMVPGFQVARSKSSNWAITARGFNEGFGNKVLVLIDGRSIYATLFAGVYWDVQDLLLDDIERIEVIRGPGATIWGANALNGVVNIITKHTKDTQGGLLLTSGGSEELGAGSARYGGKLGSQAFYRLYAKYFNRNHLVDSHGWSMADNGDFLHGGFRVDWNLAQGQSLRVQGDIYNGGFGDQRNIPSLTPPFAALVQKRNRVSGGNVLTSWDRILSERSSIMLRFYLDRNQREDRGEQEINNTFNLDWQHHWRLSKRQDIVWGVGYRFTMDHLPGTAFAFSVNPASRTDRVFSAFLQDEFTITPDRLRLTLGTRFEYNNFTGTQFQPSMQLLWTPRARHTLWAAVSQADRTPSRNLRGGRTNSTPSVDAKGILNLPATLGSPAMKPEDLYAFELGYRLQPTQRLSLDFATFYNIYHRLRSREPQTPFFEDTPLPRHLVIPRRYDNLMEGKTQGAELAANWSVISRWKLSAGYTWLQMRLRPRPESRDITSAATSGNNPRHQFHLRSNLNLPYHFELDSALYFVDRLPNQGIPSYTRLDMRVGWRFHESFDLSIGAQNLLKDRHPEFKASSSLEASQIRRSVYGKIIWRF